MDRNNCNKKNGNNNKTKFIQKQKSKQKQKHTNSNPKDYSKKYRQKQKQQYFQLKLNYQKLKEQNKLYQKIIKDLQIKLQRIQQQLYQLKYSQRINGQTINRSFQKQKQNILEKILQQHNYEEQLGAIEKINIGIGSGITSNQQNNNQINTSSGTSSLFLRSRYNIWQKYSQYQDYYGFAGKQKRNLLNYFMAQIMNNMIDDYQKSWMVQALKYYQCLLQSQKDLSKPYLAPQYMKFLQQKQMQMLRITRHQQFIVRLKFLQSKLLQKIYKFQQTSYEFYNNYVKLIDQQIDIQNHISEIKYKFTGSVCAKGFVALINWFEKSKYTKQIQMLRHQWIEVCSNKINK